MTNRKMLESMYLLHGRLKKLRKTTPLISVSEGRIHVNADFFKKCEKERLLEHVSSKRDPDGANWLTGMAKDGSRVIAIAFEKKK